MVLCVLFAWVMSNGCLHQEPAAPTEPPKPDVAVLVEPPPMVIPPTPPAASPPLPRDLPLYIRGINVDEVVTPRFDVGNIAPDRPGSANKPWLEVRTDFRVQVTWIDEATFTYFLLFEQQDSSGGLGTKLLSGVVTYEDLPKHHGHTSTMFLTPNKHARYGKVIAMRVEVTVGGRPVAMEQKVASAVSDRNWYQKPSKQILLNRNQTPFRVIDRTSYNDIKVE